MVDAMDDDAAPLLDSNAQTIVALRLDKALKAAIEKKVAALTGDGAAALLEVEK